MAKFNFTATHGVGIMVGDKLVADFARDRDNDTADGQKVYVFATDDTKVADVVRGTEGFGIVEAVAEPTPSN
jgi:hypothetical protein